MPQQGSMPNTAPLNSATYWAQVFKHMSLWGTFLIQTTRLVYLSSRHKVFNQAANGNICRYFGCYNMMALGSGGAIGISWAKSLVVLLNVCGGQAASTSKIPTSKHLQATGALMLLEDERW